MLSRADLHQYQIEAIDFIQEKNKCALFLDMGLGKTATTLTALVDLFDSFAIHRVLIIAPLRVAKSVWHNEAKKWEHLQHLEFSICTGTKAQRLKRLHESEITIISKDNVTWLVDECRHDWQFDCVIIDESTAFKSAKSQRFKSLKKVSKHFEYTVLLTGTPAPNSYLDLWSQLYLMDSGQRLGKNMKQYKFCFFNVDYTGRKFTLKATAKKEIDVLIQDVCISMSSKDYLQLPRVIYVVESFKLEPALFRQYIEFEKKLLLQLEHDTISATNKAVLANKLLQFANGALYLEDSSDYVELHNTKLDALAEIIDENPNDNFLIAYNYKSDLARLSQRFQNAELLTNDEDIILRWNQKKIRILLAHPASAGHGLNLQDGGSIIVWFGLSWSLENYQQFNARLARQGQTKPVKIIHLTIAGSIDERVLRVLQDKDSTQQSLLDALKIEILA